VTFIQPVFRMIEPPRMFIDGNAERANCVFQAGQVTLDTAEIALNRDERCAIVPTLWDSSAKPPSNLVSMRAVFARFKRIYTRTN
jgi:hypothetical protein